MVLIVIGGEHRLTLTMYTFSTGIGKADWEIQESVPYLHGRGPKCGLKDRRLAEFGLRTVPFRFISADSIQDMVWLISRWMGLIQSHMWWFGLNPGHNNFWKTVEMKN